ncbi:MAG: hypothetical protein AAF941_06025 [Pseudomonadota bacterium]
MPISKKGYDLTFDGYDEWLAFMDRASNPALRAGSIRELVSQELFERYASKSTASVERFRYGSDGLAINDVAITSPLRRYGQMVRCSFRPGEQTGSH